MLTTEGVGYSSSVGGISTGGLTAIQRHGYSQTPDAGFFETFQTAFDRLEVSTSAEPGDSVTATSLADVLGTNQTEMAQLWKVDEEDQREYARILDDAYSSGGIHDPKAFLQSLSSSDMDIVRRMHRLADTIRPEILSQEGAENLLLPEGYSVDLNRDGIDEVGAGKILHFPPRDAPAEFTDAWFESTKEMSGGDYMLHAMTFLVAFHPPVEGGGEGAGLPSDQLSSYRTIVDDYLDELDRRRGQLPDGQYDRDYPFFRRLQESLQDS